MANEEYEKAWEDDESNRTIERFEDTYDSDSDFEDEEKHDDEGGNDPPVEEDPRRWAWVSVVRPGVPSPRVLSAGTARTKTSRVDQRYEPEKEPRRCKTEGGRRKNREKGGREVSTAVSSFSRDPDVFGAPRMSSHNKPKSKPYVSVRGNKLNIVDKHAYMRKTRKLRNRVRRAKSTIQNRLHPAVDRLIVSRRGGSTAGRTKRKKRTQQRGTRPMRIDLDDSIHFNRGFGAPELVHAAPLVRSHEDDKVADVVGGDELLEMLREDEPAISVLTTKANASAQRNTSLDSARALSPSQRRAAKASASRRFRFVENIP